MPKDNGPTNLYKALKEKNHQSRIMNSMKILLKTMENEVLETMMGENGALVPCWWECKNGAATVKTVFQFLSKSNKELPYDAEILS